MLHLKYQMIAVINLKRNHFTNLTRLVDGLDRDDAGREGWSNIKKFTRGISTYDTIFPTNAKDINDLSDIEFKNIKIR